jgi:hypothetical protein
LTRSSAIINYYGGYFGAIFATYFYHQSSLLPSLVANTGAVIGSQFFAVAFMVAPKLFLLNVLLAHVGSIKAVTSILH